MSDPVTPLIFVITNAGRAAIVNAQNTGTAPVTISHIGVSDTAIAADAGMTVLAGEIKRLETFGGSGVADDTIHVTLRDVTADVYALRSFALYLSDGTLFGLYGQADVISDKTAASTILLSADIKLADIAAVSIEFGNTDFQNPPATTEVQGVVELATSPETIAKTDTTRAVTVKGLWDAFSSWISTAMAGVWTSSNDGAGSGMDADLLDGQHGSWYAAIADRLGFTPANRAGDIFSGPVKRDAFFFLDLVGTSPQVAFDAGAYLLYDRVNNRLNIYIGSSRVGWIDESGSFNVTGEMTAGGHTVWHAGNDGAGSGSDAGLLAGQLPDHYTNIIARLGYTPLNQTAYTPANVLAKLLTVDGTGSGLDAALFGGQLPAHYANIIARLGYTPLNQTAYTPADVLAKLLTVDGTGSGLDAALFGGQLPAFYMAIADRLGYTPIQQGTGVDQISNNVKIGWSTEARLKATVDGSNLGSFVMENTMMTQFRNYDGAGSGADADLLDGQHGSFYLPASSYSANDVKAKLIGVDGSGSGVDADLLDGLNAAVFVQKSGIMADFASAMALSWAGAFGANSFRIGNLLFQTGIVSTIGPNGSAAINFPDHFSAPPVVIPIRRTAGAVTNGDSGVGIEGTPTVSAATVRNTTAGTTIDVIWVAFGPI